MKSFSLFSFYCSRLLTTLLFISFVNTLAAQKKTETSFTLLWYKGKKINDTTLMKTTGEKITYSPSKSSVTVNYPTGKASFPTARTAINNSTASKMQIDKLIIGDMNSPRPPGMVVAANEGFDQAVTEVSAILEDRLQLHPPEERILAQKVPKSIGELPPQIRSYYDDVIKYVTHSDPGSSFAVVAPPNFQFDYCYPCDKERKAAYTRDSLRFINSFLTEENLHLKKAIAVLEYLQPLKPQPGPDSVFLFSTRTEMFNAMKTIVARIEKKVVDVWNTYKGDPAKVPFLVILLFELQRKHELIGLETGNGFPDAAALAARLLMVSMDVLYKAKEERDYKILLNVQGFTYLFKLAEMMGVEMANFEGGIMEYLKLNRFKVTVDADAKITPKGASQMAKLHFEGPFDAFPELTNTTCELKWFPSGMASAKGIIYKVEEIELITPDGPATYTGTREFASKRPWLKLDFCNEKRDSALFFPFFPHGGMDTWTMGPLKDYPMQMVNTVFMSSFMDAEELKKKASQINKEQMIQQMSSVFQNKVQPAMGNMNMNPTTMTAADYKKAADLMDAADEITNQTIGTSLYYFPVKGRLKNNQKMIFDQTLDGKKISSFPNIAYANFRVRIEHVEE